MEKEMKKIALGLAPIIALGVLAGCSTQQPTGDASDLVSPATSAASEASEGLGLEPDTVDTDLLESKKFYAVDLKVKSKQCFGSAGCNVEVTPDISMLETENLPTGTVELTYKITGDESGPIIETTTLYLKRGKYDVETTYMSTTSTYIEPKAKVVSATYYQ